MNRNNKLICICGSSRFKDKIQQAQKELTLQGYIVLGMHIFSQDNHIDLTQDQISMLKENHKYKIDISDIVYVVNPDGYIGESTKEEIEYALSKGKEIMYSEPIKLIPTGCIRSYTPKNNLDEIITLENFLFLFAGDPSEVGIYTLINTNNSSFPDHHHYNCINPASLWRLLWEKNDPLLKRYIKRIIVMSKDTDIDKLPEYTQGYDICIDIDRGSYLCTSTGRTVLPVIHIILKQ